MIISFSVENWKSFSKKNTLSMVASRERQHGERLSRIDKYRMRVLPIATIYGGNASGKSNFISALSFAQELIVKGTRKDESIPVETFLLDVKNIEQPVKFIFELLIGNTIYEYSFAVNREIVLEEKLVEITSNNEKIMYCRCGNEPNFDVSLESNDRLHFVFEGTLDNQLFLTNSVSQNFDIFKPVYDWFSNILSIISPDTIYMGYGAFFDEKHQVNIALKELLPQLDTGISSIGSEFISFDNLPIPKMVKKDIQRTLKEGESVALVDKSSSERILVIFEKGEIIARKMHTYHKQSDGNEKKFDMDMESDGTKRLFDLLPSFSALQNLNSNKVFVIDEIDRSLHSLLVQKLLELYLSKCNKNSRTQLLFTTHNLLLMDQKLLRRDEMWMSERDVRGSSSLFSLSDFEGVRSDRDIRKSYLQGRFGGIPQIFLDTRSPNISNEE